MSTNAELEPAEDFGSAAADARSEYTVSSHHAAGLDDALPDYPLHPSSFFASMCVHAAAIVFLATVGFGPPSRRPRPVYDELIKPHEHEILYYHFKGKLPDVKPIRKIGDGPVPRAVERSERAIIANSPKPKSTQVFIAVPAPKIEVHQDMPAPLVVASMEAVLPPPPSKPQPKAFVPPPPSPREPKLPLPVVVAQAPTLAAPSVTAPVRASMPTLALTPPPPRVPEAAVARVGNATTDIAVASLVPNSETEQKVAAADVPGRFSRAPVQGEVSSGANSLNASLTVPDLAIREAKKPSDPPPVLTHEVLYAEKMRGIPIASLSAPLRPSSRMIPAPVEARLQGRNVYTIVIPMEHMPTYTGDWIIWFSERNPKPGVTPLIRAPLLVRKLEPVAADQVSGDQRGERVQLSAVLGKDGKLSAITLLSTVAQQSSAAILQDLASWELQAATRDGAPVDIDVIIEIPFNLPTLLARSSHP